MSTVRHCQPYSKHDPSHVPCHASARPALRLRALSHPVHVIERHALPPAEHRLPVRSRIGERVDTPRNGFAEGAAARSNREALRSRANRSSTAPNRERRGEELDTRWRTDLFIVRHIILSCDNVPVASEGEVRRIEDWNPKDVDLTAKTYRCRVR